MGIKYGNVVVKLLVISLVITAVISSLELSAFANVINTYVTNEASLLHNGYEGSSETEARTKVIQLSSVMTPEGVVITEIRTNLPLGGSLIIKAGTKVTAGGKPVKTLIIKTLAKAPPSPKTQVVVGPIYLIEPKNTIFSKSVTIILPFNPFKVPKGYRLFIAYYDELTRTWVPLVSTKIDYNTLTAIAKINHLGIISVIAFRVLYVVGTSPTTTLTKYITSTTTLTKSVTTYLTHTSVVTTTSTYIITFPSTFIITLTNTKAPTTYVNVTSTVTVTNYSVTTSTITITTTKYIYQTSYIYIGLIAVIVAAVILITMSLLIPRR